MALDGLVTDHWKAYLRGVARVAASGGLRGSLFHVRQLGPTQSCRRGYRSVAC